MPPPDRSRTQTRNDTRTDTPTSKDRQAPLDTPVQFLKGVGPRRAEILAKLDIYTVNDLLHHIPVRYEFSEQVVPIIELQPGATAAVIAVVERIEQPRFTDPRRTITAHVRDHTESCRVRWFNAPYIYDKLDHGTILRIHGKVEWYRDRPRFTNPRIEIMETKDQINRIERVWPIYPATQHLTTAHLAQLVQTALSRYQQDIREILPESLRQKRSLPPRLDAFVQVHRPANTELAELARQRLIYDELLMMQVVLLMRRAYLRTSTRAAAIRYSDTVDKRIRRRFPFTLTDAQQHAVDEILRDLQQKRPMNRLLQGDVGSGKTAVAVYACLAVIASGLQVAVMAPTEVLARQHHERISQYLAGSRVRWASLTGSTGRSERSDIYERLSNGELDLLIGTQALLETSVTFKRLGLVIVDEQHKFGVLQRVTIRSKGIEPHCLVMTATPIPRTLSLTVFGDLDVSSIKALPPGRQPVTTYVYGASQRNKAFTFIRERLQAGERAYIVYPRVEEDEQQQLRAATIEAERLANEAFADFRVGLVHGKLSAADKQQVMQQFRDGDIHILVATTVIEVGIDVPQATVIAIEHADRFGLAQLHQLRGRVGRGDKPGYCLLMTDKRDPADNARLEIMRTTNDGFRIAEEDLRLRGPGQLFGTAQHGLPELKIANPVEDYRTLVTARDDAAELVRQDAFLTWAVHANLREEIRRRYRGKLALIGIG